MSGARRIEVHRSASHVTQSHTSCSLSRPPSVTDTHLSPSTPCGQSFLHCSSPGTRSFPREAHFPAPPYAVIRRPPPVTMTARDGRVSKLEQVYLRGSHIKMFVLPDVLKNAPVFKPVQKMKKKDDEAKDSRGSGFKKPKKPKS